MKLKNKITGEINIVNVDEDYFNIYQDDGDYVCPVTLKELNEGWEDYVEPKGYWYYDTTCGRVEKLNHNEDKEIDSSIGNCFETKEEAEKAVEKLKAWKRLKDNGFEFDGIRLEGSNCLIKTKLKDNTGVTFDHAQQFYEDVDLLFGGEE